MYNKKEILISVLDTYNAELVSYEYNKKVFGNFMVVIKIGEQMHTFVTDRGEIYYNDKMLSDNSYHNAGCDDTFAKLLETIKQELSRAV